MKVHGFSPEKIEFLRKEQKSWQNFVEIWGDIDSEKLIKDHNGTTPKQLLDVLAEQFVSVRRIIPLLLQGKKRGKTKSYSLKKSEKALEESLVTLVSEHEKLVISLTKVPDKFYENKTSLFENAKKTTITQYIKIGNTIREMLQG